MQISKINPINVKNYNTRISFGESEGPQFYEERDYISSRGDYEYRKQNINYVYDSKLKWLRENNTDKDSLFYKNAVKNIEELRAKALCELEKLFRKSFPGK